MSVEERMKAGGVPDLQVLDVMYRILREGLGAGQPLDPGLVSSYVRKLLQLIERRLIN